jgi:3-oxoacyl-[acyl-carrier protein] reductase
MSSSLKNKKAIITGASSGIGRAVACRFAKEGACVALIARRQGRLQEIKENIQKQGGEAWIYPFDLYQAEKIPDLVKQIKKDMGDADVLVNNAGVGSSGPFTQTTLEEYDQTFNLNMRALYMMTRECLPFMLENQEGSIINIGSMAGKRGLPRVAIYCASKFAVTGFSEALLEEVRDQNIKVSVICPGLVKTEFFDQRKKPPPGAMDDYIQVEDIADAALLCASHSQTATFKEIVIRPRRPVG